MIGPEKMQGLEEALAKKMLRGAKQRYTLCAFYVLTLCAVELDAYIRSEPAFTVHPYTYSHHDFAAEPAWASLYELVILPVVPHYWATASRSFVCEVLHPARCQVQAFWVGCPVPAAIGDM